MNRPPNRRQGVTQIRYPGVTPCNHLGLRQASVLLYALVRRIFITAFAGCPRGYSRNRFHDAVLSADGFSGTEVARQYITGGGVSTVRGYAAWEWWLLGGLVYTPTD